MLQSVFMGPLFSTLIFVITVFMTAGCSKPPAPPKPPTPMTQEYLLTHMRIDVDETRSVRTVTPLAVINQAKLCEFNATLSTVLSAEQPLDETNGTTNYLLLFSVRSSLWGEFKSMIDSFGNRLSVTPYTSYIRSGVYTENFFVPVSAAWMQQNAQEEVTLLLLGPKCEISTVVPKVYPAALLHFLHDFSKTSLPAGP